MPVATRAEGAAVLDLNSELKMGLITQEEYNQKLRELSSSLAQASAQTTALTAKQKLLNAASKAAVSAFNGIKTLGISLLFSKVIEKISEIVHRQEDLREKAEEASSALSEQNNELEDLKQRYIEVLDSKTSETEKNKEILEIKEKLIEQYGIEENALKNINTERQKTIDLIDEEARRKRDTWLRENAEAIEEAKKAIDGRNITELQNIASISFKTINESPFKGDDIDKSVLKLMKISDDEFGNKALSVNTKNLIEFYDTYEKIASILNSKQNIRDLSDNERSLLFRANSVVETYKKTIEDNKNLYETSSEHIAANFFEDFISIDENSLDKITAENVGNWRKKLLNELSENQGLSVEAKEQVQKLMKSALQEINISPEITVDPIFTYDKEAVDNAVSAVDTMFNGGEDKNTIFDKIESFEKAVENIGKNGFIERDDYEELLEIYPALENVFIQTADGYTASLTDMVTSTRDFVAENTQIINDAQAVVLNQKSDVSKEIAEIDRKIFEARKGGYDNKYEIEQLYNTKEALVSQKNELDEVTSKLKEYKSNLQIDEEKAAVDATTESISNLNSSMKTLSGAFAEINENGTLSVDTLLTLIEQGYAAAVMYDKQSGSISLNKKVIEELTKAKIVAQIAELQGRLETSKHTEEIKAQILALQNLKDNWNKIYDGTFADTSKSSLEDNSVPDTQDVQTTDYYKENAEEQIAALKHEYEIGNLTTKDYYTQLLDLAKYFYEGKEEYLDDYRKYEEEVYDGLQKAQKERLEAEKDKISEVNDEKEKSIELIKAYNELTNAKNNKSVRSYSEEKGFEYVQDNEAILKAKQNLDKLISDYKTNLIDKQIDEIEKMNFDKLREALNNPIEIPTNEAILQESLRQTYEQITNNNNNNKNTTNYFNIEKIVTENPDDFIEQLDKLLKQGVSDMIVGK